MTKKTTPKRKSTPKAPAPKAPYPDIEQLGPPPEGDPEAQAQYFMSLLDAFAQHGSPESKRLRSVLIEAVDTYSTDSKADLGKARQELIGKLAGVEASVVGMTLTSVRKMRDRVLQDSRSIGTRSQVGKNMKAFAEGLGIMADAMELMLEAGRAGDLALREKASGLMGQASELLTGIARA